MKNFEQIIVANWKMQLSIEEAKKLARTIKNLATEKKISAKKKIVLCPDFLSLPEVAKMLKDSDLSLGAQDGFYEDIGAFTSQVSIRELKASGCEYIILGHSERRALGETNLTINLKVKAALKHGLIPIICVGETFTERQEGNKGTIIMHQVFEALQGVEVENHHQIIIAYEPVWVIGSGQAISGEEASQTAAMIRQSYVDVMEGRHTDSLGVIYGGSVDPSNINHFTKMANIRGALVGGASLKATTFVELIQNS
ncbi:MAG: triose-phosphate isomerase [Parcubacteria group bacterium]|nr:MAG: triose-phosphate isomerase [Parcubacteria group bacterium]